MNPRACNQPPRLISKGMWGSELSVEWQGRAVKVWVPDPLSEHDLTLSKATTRLTERAAAVSHASEASQPDGSLLARADAIASSRIEQVSAPPEQVVAAERDANASQGRRPG